MEVIVERTPFETCSIISSYHTAAARVSAENLGAFRPLLVAQALGRYQVDALEIFMDPPKDILFPEVPEFLEYLHAHPKLDFTIWTQGEMDADALTAQKGQGFQQIKIRASGIEDQFDPSWQERLEKVGLSTVVGGFDKTSEAFLAPVIKAMRQGGYDEIILIDDKRRNLEKSGEVFQKLGERIKLYHIDREGKEELGEFTTEAEKVRTLTEVQVGHGRTFVMCDFDGTLGDTKKIRRDHERRLTALLG